MQSGPRRRPVISGERLSSVIVESADGAVTLFTATVRTEITRIAVYDNAKTVDANDQVFFFHIPKALSVDESDLVLKLKNGDTHQALTVGSGITLGPGDTLTAVTEGGRMIVNVYGVPSSIVGV